MSIIRRDHSNCHNSGACDNYICHSLISRAKKLISKLTLNTSLLTGLLLVSSAFLLFGTDRLALLGYEESWDSLSSRSWIGEYDRKSFLAAQKLKQNNHQDQDLFPTAVVFGEGAFRDKTSFEERQVEAPTIEATIEKDEDLLSGQTTFEDLESSSKLQDNKQSFSTQKSERDKAGVRSIVYKVKVGDTLGKIWRMHGASSLGGALAAKALTNLGISLAALRAGDYLTLQVSDDPRDILGLDLRLPNKSLVKLEGNSKDGYTAQLEQVAVREERRKISGAILTSFSNAAKTNGLSYAVIDQVVDLFSNRIAFHRDLQAGDSFTVSLTEIRSIEDDQLVSIKSLHSASIYSSGKLYAAIAHPGRDGKLRFYDEAGRAIDSGFLRYPLRFSRISSTFSHARFHPVTGKSRPHYGVDFAAPVGTSVRSVADGVVVASGYNHSAGNFIKIAHGARYVTEYFHLSKIGSNAKFGKRVARGDVIGAVGSTGLSTGPHLHFGMFDRGRYIDPFKNALPTLSDDADRLPQIVLAQSMAELKAAHLHFSIAKRDVDEGDKKRSVS
jgi:murein DD-endopeptidase MepM/ murein hydrolase activator NlpD